MSPPEFPKPPEHASRIRWRICLFLTLAVALNFLDRLNFSVAAKSLQEQFGISNNQLGLIFSAFGIGYALFQVPGGALGDLFGPRRVLTFTIVIWSACTSLTAWTSRASAFAAVRFLIGMAEAPALTNANRVVANWVPVSERARGNASFVMGVGLGGVFTPPLVAWMGAVWGWRWTFLICGLLGVVLAAGWWLYSTEIPEQHPAVNAAELRLIQEGQHAQPKVRSVPWRAIFSSMNIWLVVISYLIMGYTTYVFYTWFYLYVVTVRHLRPIEAGVWSAAPFAAFGVMSLAGGVVSDLVVSKFGRKWGRRLCVQLGTFGAAAVLLVGGRVQNPYWAVCILSAGAGFNAFATVSWWATTIDVCRDYAGSLSGVMNMAGNIGGAISPALTPWLAGRFGWITAIDVAAATIGIAGLFWFFVNAEESVATVDNTARQTV
jgi:ACS family glucarate transporter-like MFS transporter